MPNPQTPALEAPPLETLALEANGLESTALAMGEGPIVLCLHGFPDHNQSFRHQMPVLANGGFRAVAPMMRGYEPSSTRPGNIAAHHPMHLATDAIQWARTLGDGAPVHLVGHDWGGITGFVACQLEPALFRSYCSIAVTCSQSMEDGIRHHPIQLRNSWYMFFFQLRGLADRIVESNDFAFIERLWRDWSPGWNWEPEAMGALKNTLRQPGVLWSTLAYYRATLNPFLAEFRQLRNLTRQPTDVPVLTVTGAIDGCMDTRIFDYVDETLFPKGIRTERIERGGHFVHQELPDVFNPLLLDWLRLNSPTENQTPRR